MYLCIFLLKKFSITENLYGHYIGFKYWRRKMLIEDKCYRNFDVNVKSQLLIFLNFFAQFVREEIYLSVCKSTFIKILVQFLEACFKLYKSFPFKLWYNNFYEKAEIKNFITFIENGHGKFNKSFFIDISI